MTCSMASPGKGIHTVQYMHMYVWYPQTTASLSNYGLQIPSKKQSRELIDPSIERANTVPRNTILGSYHTGALLSAPCLLISSYSN